MHTEDIEYHAAGQRFVGFLAVDESRSGKRPGILLAHEGGGLQDLTRSFALRLAQLGYVAFAMDYHGDGRVMTDMDQVMPRLNALMVAPAPIREIAATALKVLADRPETDAGKMAAIGYCFGGATVLELARAGADLKAVVGFHSGLYASEPAKAPIKPVILTQIGVDDPIITAEDRIKFEQEMQAAGADWRMIVYGNAGHSFTNPDVGRLGRAGFAYHKPSDERSWQAMLDVFAEVFGD